MINKRHNIQKNIFQDILNKAEFGFIVLGLGSQIHDILHEFGLIFNIATFCGTVILTNHARYRFSICLTFRLFHYLVINVLTKATQFVPLFSMLELVNHLICLLNILFRLHIKKFLLLNIFVNFLLLSLPVNIDLPQLMFL